MHRTIRFSSKINLYKKIITAEILISDARNTDHIKMDINKQ